MPRNVKNLRIYISNLSYVVFLSVKTWIFFSFYLPLYLNLIVHLCVLSSSLGLKILMNLIKQLKNRKNTLILNDVNFCNCNKNTALETFCTCRYLFLTLFFLRLLLLQKFGIYFHGLKLHFSVILHLMIFIQSILNRSQR